jgi:N-acetylglucosamine-6-phosphate deacetylase
MVGPRLSQRLSGAARVLGVHLEGPFINPRKLGAQPRAIRPGSLEEVLSLDAFAKIRIVTLAPELPGNLELVTALARLGIAVQLGHTLASYDETLAALDAGAHGFTHLFNAMSGFDHRNPGAAVAAMAHAEHAELIPDLIHVHEGALRAALRAIPRLHFVTDATAPTGLPDGSYSFAGEPAEKKDGAVRLADGTLAGSVLTMDQALRNLVSVGLPLADAARRLSLRPADYLGIQNRGRITVGAWADLVVLSPVLELKEVYVEGEPIEL